MVPQIWDGYKFDQISCNEATLVDLIRNLKLGT
jgi:hypothetical protein